MNKSTFSLMLLVFAFSIGANAQNVNVTGTATLHVGPNSLLKIKNAMTIATTSSVTVSSNATRSASFIVDGGVTGNVTYNRHIESDGTNWRMVSSPLTGANVSSFINSASNGIRTGASSSTNKAVAEFNNTNDIGFKWVYYNTNPSGSLPVGKVNQKAITGDFTPGKGYAMSRSASGNITFSGGYNNADVAIIVPKSTGGSSKAALIGNPYPYHLPFNHDSSIGLIKANENILPDNAVNAYYWNGNSYDVYNYLSKQNSFLAPGQGFFIVAKADNSTFTFKKANAAHSNGGVNNVFRKGNGGIQTLVLGVSNGTNNNETTLKFVDNNASTDLDKGYDAAAFTEANPSNVINGISLDTHLVSNSKGVNFTLQALPSSYFDVQGASIPLSITTAANSNLTFSIKSSDLATDVNVYIEDTEKNTFKKINLDSYSTTTATALSGIGRFYLHSVNGSLSVDDIGLTSVSLYKTNDHTLRITGLSDEGQAEVSLFSISGKKVLSSSFDSKRVQDIAIPSSLSTGIYLARVNSNNQEITKKIIIE